MVNFDPLKAEICLPVWGIPAHFNEFHVLAALLHGTPVYLASAKHCGVEQRAPSIFGRAAITLGIGPHSSLSCTGSQHALIGILCLTGDEQARTARLAFQLNFILAIDLIFVIPRDYIYQG